MRLDNLAAYSIVVALAAYYLGAWLLVGRKRAAGSIAVRYQPPEGLSPAVIRYLCTMSSDGRTYAAIVAQLAARKVLAIVPDKDSGATYLEKLTEDYHVLRGLPEEERRVFKDLLEFDDRVRLERPELSTVKRLQEMLEEQLAQRYVRRNFAWVIFGLLATVAATIWLGLSSGIFGVDEADAWMGASFAGFSVGMYGLAGYWIWDTNRLAFTLALRGLYRRRTLPLLLFFIALYPSLWYFLIRTVAPQFAIVTTLMILLNGFAAPALRNYTSAGRKVRDEIEGFRQFLAGTEQDRLQRVNTPGKRVQVDPEMIPYAIALDLREAWGDDLGIKTMVETAL
jgi:Predicted membrane protein (DUF2207) C-terminal domain